MNLQRVLDEVYSELEPSFGCGKVPTHIPALAKVSARRFGMAVRTLDGSEFTVGDATERFSAQSISKVFSLTLAIQKLGDRLWERIGREPSGNPFNSLVQLELEQGTPRNPFINAGAIAVADRLVSHSDDASAELAALVSSVVGARVPIDEEVLASERSTGHRNAASAHFMKSFGKLDNPVEAVLDVYFRQCSLSMSCVELARACGYLAYRGKDVWSGTQIVSERQAHRINALMMMCGTYDSAGEFAFRVGMPCKSGVSGGIVAVVPGKMTLCVWSPGLSESGNSELGLRALEAFSAKTHLSLF